MTGRLGGGAIAALGLALAVLPFLAWYSAGPPGDRATASGLDGAGELWLLPPLGLAAAVAGARLATAPPERVAQVARWAGPVAAAAGLLALAFALRAALGADLELRAALPGGPERVPAPVDREPAAALAPVCAGLLAAVGAALAWAGRRA
ncbi:hypothetical protein [Miltoncostaea marina]|uniref:hypothetical protein n=1 Tax=Miltoncostaea marina TaxID=2843215 RepID=UPI001C3E2F47|nr:hypothetical protein [Miltoncostaea marina]